MYNQRPQIDWEKILLIIGSFLALMQFALYFCRRILLETTTTEWLYRLIKPWVGAGYASVYTRTLIDICSYGTLVCWFTGGIIVISLIVLKVTRAIQH